MYNYFIVQSLKDTISIIHFEDSISIDICFSILAYYQDFQNRNFQLQL